MIHGGYVCTRGSFHKFRLIRPDQSEYAIRKGHHIIWGIGYFMTPDLPMWRSLCHSVGGPVTPRRRSSHGFDEADISRPIHFQDPAAEFAKKETRKFH